MRLEVGDPAPPFRRTDDTGNEVSLGDFAGKQLVIYFYPKAFTPGCTTEACDFRDHYDTFVDTGYSVVGVSPDAPEELAKFRGEHDLPFSLLSDPDHATAEAYGAWGPKKNYGREYEGIIRSTIVVGADGNVENAWYNVRAKGHVDRVAGAVLAGDA